MSFFQILFYLTHVKCERLKVYLKRAGNNRDRREFVLETFVYIIYF